MLGPACSKALPVWKRLATEKFESLDIEVDIDKVIYDEEDGFYGRMCRACTSALVRFEKIKSSTLKNINDAVNKLINGDRWSKIQSRKRARDDGNDEELVGRSRALTPPTLPNTDAEEDVAVGYNTLMICILMSLFKSRLLSEKQNGKNYI